LANITYMQETKLPEQAAEKGSWLMGRLNVLKERRPLIGDVRGKGLMVGIELVMDQKTKEPAAAQTKAVRAFCREHGLLVGSGGSLGNVIRFQPPLVITKDQLEQALSILDKALVAVA
jgi:4-aminobutyrate aminotransferase-like enzyme